MIAQPPAAVQAPLTTAQIIWLGTVRPDGRPHLVPIWFSWVRPHLYVCVEPESVKARNMRSNPQVVLALAVQTTHIVCEGIATPAEEPWDAAIAGVFWHKYRWDITTDETYRLLLQVTPHQWKLL